MLRPTGILLLSLLALAAAASATEYWYAPHYLSGDDYSVVTFADGDGAADNIEIWQGGALVDSFTVAIDSAVTYEIGRPSEEIGVDTDGYRFVSDGDARPIVYGQFGVKALSVGATSILPEQAIGKQFWLTIPEGAEASEPGTSPEKTYVTLVATQDNTDVRIVPTHDLEGANGMPGMSTGISTPFFLDAYEYAHYQVDEVDVTGTRIISGKPIAVFVGKPNFLNQGPQGQTTDRVDLQVLPDQLGGTEFVVCNSGLARDNEQQDRFVVMALEDGVTELTNSLGQSLADLDGAGDWLAFSAGFHFTLESTKPVSVMQVLRKGGSGGDADAIPVAPVDQWLSEFAYGIPTNPDWSHPDTQFSYTAIVAGRIDSSVVIDGVPYSSAGWDPIGDEPEFGCRARALESPGASIRQVEGSGDLFFTSVYGKKAFGGVWAAHLGGCATPVVEGTLEAEIKSGTPADGAVELSWTPLSFSCGETWYEVTRITTMADGSNPQRTTYPKVATTTFTDDSPFVECRHYRWKVQAFNELGQPTETDVIEYWPYDPCDKPSECPSINNSALIIVEKGGVLENHILSINDPVDVGGVITFGGPSTINFEFEGTGSPNSFYLTIYNDGTGGFEILDVGDYASTFTMQLTPEHDLCAEESKSLPLRVIAQGEPFDPEPDPEQPAQYTVPPQCPYFTENPAVKVVVGETMDMDFPVDDPDNVGYILDFERNWLTYNAVYDENQKRLTWTPLPEEEGVHKQAIMKMRDGFGSCATELHIKITVLPDPTVDEAEEEPDEECTDCDEVPDQDGDTIPDGEDNCIDVPNKTQLDRDGDDIGNACDEDEAELDESDVEPEVAVPEEDDECLTCSDVEVAQQTKVKARTAEACTDCEPPVTMSGIVKWGLGGLGVFIVVGLTVAFVRSRMTRN